MKASRHRKKKRSKVRSPSGVVGTLAIAVVLAAATVVVYAPVTQFDFVLLDDPDYVRDNPVVRAGLTRPGLEWAFTTFHAANWHPLTWISHMVDVELVGARPGKHHAANVVVHALNVLLVFAVFRSMTGHLWPSALVAALFALHPINVESVAWISERKNTLSATLWLAATLAYVAYVRRRGLHRYLATLVLFVLGLMTKPVLVTLPFVLLLLDYWPLRRFAAPRDGRRLLLEKLPMLILVVPAMALTMMAQRSGDTIRDDMELPLPYRLSNALVSYVRYLLRLFWPQDLALLYPHPGLASAGVSWPSWQVAGSAALLILITALVIWFAVRDRNGEDRHRYLPVGWLWYLGAMFPMIGVVQVGPQALADRYAYLTFIGLFVMLAWGAGELRSRWNLDRRVVAVVAVMVLVALGTATRQQLRFWRDSDTLFRRSLEVTEENWLIHSIYGAHLAMQHRIDEGMEHISEALRINPQHANAHYNLANLLQVKGRFREAVEHLEEAVRLAPHFVKARHRLGVAYEGLGMPEEAAEQFLQTVVIADHHAEAHYRLGRLRAQALRMAEALTHFRRAAELRPDWADPIAAEAWILATYPDQLDPERAIELAVAACELDGGERASLLRTLMTAYAVGGRLEEAIETGRRARELAAAERDRGLLEQIDRELAAYRRRSGQ